MKEKIDQLKKAVSSDFNNFKEFSVLSEKDINTIDELRKFISKKLSGLMENKFDSLLKLLYRIDINENKVKDVIQSDNNYKADLLAELIIERQIQKIKTRQKYKSKDSENLLE